MGILDNIVAKQNLFLDDLKHAEKSGYETYIYGAGWCAKQAEILIRANTDFNVAGKLVNKEYLLPDDDADCLESFFTKMKVNEKINIIPAFYKYTSECLQPYMDKINLIIYRDCFERNAEIDPSIRGYAYYEKEAANINRLYNYCEDEKSKRVLEAYINQQISMDFRYIRKVQSSHQYFDEEIISFGNNEIYVDCGAYNGDTAMDFVESLRKSGGRYKKIISFEPNEINYAALVKRNIPNNVCINKGVSEKCGTSYYNVDGAGTRITDEGQLAIELATIDNCLKDDKVTFIKMDIEGEELSALRGAAETIMRCRPTLAICIYHKPEDLWEIPDYIRSLVPEYKFYVRNYYYTATELVLYAKI